MKKWTVLLVEDNTDHGILIRARLTALDENLDIYIAETAEEGLEYLAERSVDLIISDYELPGMNGIEFLKTLRERDLAYPLIFLTGQGSEQMAIDALRLGASDYFTKEEGLARYERLLNSVHKALHKVDMEKELVEYRSFLEGIIETIPDPIFIKDREHRWVMLNRALCELVGLPRESMMYRSDYDFFPTSQADFFWKKDEEVLNKGESLFISEEPITDSSGKIHYLSTSKVPLRNKAGSITHIVGIITDITKRKEHDEELMRSELYYRMLVEKTYILVAVIDYDGTVKYQNSSIEKSLGYKSEEVKGRDFFESLVHPDDRDKMVSDYQLLRDNSCGTSRWVARLRHKDGSWHIFEGLAYNMADQEPLRGVVFYYRYLTEHLSMEIEARKHSSLVENSREFIGMATMTGKVTYINRAGLDMVGISNVTEAQKTTLYEFVPDERKTNLKDNIIEEVKSKGHWEGTGRIRNFKTGRLVDVNIMTFIVKDESGEEPLCLATIMHDVTAQKEFHERLKAQNRELEGFIHAVSHDIKTPLISIREYSALLLRSLGEKVDSDEMHILERINLNSQKTIEMIKGLQDYARFASKNRHFEKFNIGKVIREVITDLGEGMEIPADVSFKVKSTWPQIIGDRTIIYQVIVNLLSNAIKYGGRQIEAGWSRVPGEHQIWIKDDGMGIEDEFKPKVFDVFTRSPHVAKIREGAGVGLAIVKKAVERHGGRVWFNSTAGKGTVFFFSIPDEIPVQNDKGMEIYEAPSR